MLGKNESLACHIFRHELLQAEAKLRFSVRGFGCAPF